MSEETKFCKYCGSQVYADAVMCPNCGRQIENLKGEKADSPQIIINNSNTNTNVAGQPYNVKCCNKWVSLALCVFLGYLGAHKFYEGKTGKGILYLFTVGLFGIGWIIDIISILTKPNPYYA
ncbi:MAG: NINE protein [Erysipelotrichia bacterium]|nr:NINE protein [Erysipelotrichia bacterium]